LHCPLSILVISRLKFPSLILKYRYLFRLHNCADLPHYYN
jgi:hypothetical protein